MIEVVVNGETRKIGGRIDLQRLIEELGLPTRRIAVELNENVVRRKDWAEVQVSDKDKIEIIHFVGGG